MSTHQPGSPTPTPPPSRRGSRWQVHKILFSLQKFHTQDEIVSHAQKKNFSHVKTFHMHYKIVSYMRKKFTWTREFHIRGKIVSHVWKKFHMYRKSSEYFTCMWITAVVVLTFISQFLFSTCFSHTLHMIFTHILLVVYSNQWIIEACVWNMHCSANANEILNF